MDIKYDYKDISLISNQISTIRSRDDINIKEELFPNFYLSSPIISSPMKDVTNGKLAKKIRELGGVGIIHRFQSIEDQILECNIVGECICAVGLDDYDRVSRLYRNGYRYFCLDIANGANIRVKEFIEALPSDICWIVGNVVSSAGFNWLRNIRNVYGIRVGVAGGNACTTKNSTGIFQPYASLIMDCYRNNDNKCFIIGDGGIKQPSDFCKSIAIGSNSVMLGSLIASTEDSPAEIINKDGKSYKLYHGSSSYNIQKIYKNKPRYIEGRSVLLEYNQETIEELITRFMDGLKSSMSYANARSLSEYRKNCEICITV